MLFRWRKLITLHFQGKIQKTNSTTYRFKHRRFLRFQCRHRVVEPFVNSNKWENNLPDNRKNCLCSFTVPKSCYILWYHRLHEETPKLWWNNRKKLFDSRFPWRSSQKKKPMRVCTIWVQSNSSKTRAVNVLVFMDIAAECYTWSAWNSPSSYWKLRKSCCSQVARNS